MKSFQQLLDETRKAEDMQELEAAADLFQYGAEKGYYSIKQAHDFNNVYWEMKDRFLAFELGKTIKTNTLDLIAIVKNAPMNIKENENELYSYVNGRLKALKGNGKKIF
ncbi:hypothetical protein IAI10_12320 [Clostridium sp. 19966]|uniref:hypothetical protein n=1 Tax=Clostridium sp. 19966 TaxID=2768166 RepID=UPI0028DDC9ED|nr:hypothetical protein [Clostridium sp. 19966]MDT8717447.1 hypothetical protein [Clostridium sp. 19966]